MLLLKTGVFLLVVSITNCTEETEVSKSTDDGAETSVEEVTIDEITSQANSLSAIRSLMIGTPDSLKERFYFNGAAAGQTHNMKSASKSVINALYGIALQEGWINSLDTPVREHLPGYFSDSMPEQKFEITLRDLLTMRSGLESTSFNNYGRWVTSSDWIHFQLAADLKYTPGTVMDYSTGNSHLLGVILTEVTGMNLRQLAQSYLFNHFGEQIPAWDRDPQGYFLGGNNMHFSPESLFQFGQIYANGGRLPDGEKVFPPGWIEDTFQRYGTSRYNDHGYGYHWWVDTYAGYETRFAWGYGGQYLFWVPELDLLTVITSSNNRSEGERGYRRELFVLLEEQIIPHFEFRHANS